jgi:hypothetical protein
VWPLFTGWAAMGAYRYRRPHVGQQAMMSNVLLTNQGALGYVTEVLSGDVNAAFGRSSHHQIWSEAMVVTPALRGLCGLETGAGGRVLEFAPQLPINWDDLEVENYPAGAARLDFSLKKNPGRMSIAIRQRRAGSSAPPLRMNLAPAFPLDARIRAVTINGRPAQFNIVRRGDIQRAEIAFDYTGPNSDIVLTYDEGTGVYVEHQEALEGASNRGLRILRSRAAENDLQLTLEGLGGQTYDLQVHTPGELGAAPGVKQSSTDGKDTRLSISFEGQAEEYVRREVTIPLSKTRPRGKRK